MSESNHVLEEVRSLRGAHADVLAEMRQLCVQVRELVIELRHTQGAIDSFKGEMDGLKVDVQALQLESAMNKPILDIARSINSKMWMTIIAAMVAIAAQGVDWSKFAGG